METKFGLLMGGGKELYYLRGFRNEQFNSVKQGLEICDREGITRLNVAYSGLYYERRNDGWWMCGTTDATDQWHGLPPEGKLFWAIAPSEQS